MPVLARAGFDKNSFVVFIDHAAAAQFHQQRDAVEIARQHDIAAAAKHQLRQAAEPGVASKRRDLRFFRQPNGMLGADIETERVMREQRVIGEKLELGH